MARWGNVIYLKLIINSYEGEWQNDRKEGKGCYKWKKW